MTPAHPARSARKLSTPLLLGAGAIAAVAFALGLGASSLDIAKFGAPHNLALHAAQIGLGAPAQAAPLAVEVGYLPARLAAQGRDDEAHPQPF